MELHRFIALQFGKILWKTALIAVRHIPRICPPSSQTIYLSGHPKAYDIHLWWAKSSHHASWLTCWAPPQWCVPPKCRKMHQRFVLHSGSSDCSCCCSVNKKVQQNMLLSPFFPLFPPKVLQFFISHCDKRHDKSPKFICSPVIHQEMRFAAPWRSLQQQHTGSALAKELSLARWEKQNLQIENRKQGEPENPKNKSDIWSNERTKLSYVPLFISWDFAKRQPQQ